MPIRIYALAKQLNVDSKLLVDICTKAGITGKGSALASLSDDEEAKVRAFIDGSKKKKAAAPAATAAVDSSRAITRDDYIAPGGGTGGKIPVLRTPRPKRPATPTKPAAPEEPAAAPTPAETAPPPHETPIAAESASTDASAPQPPAVTPPGGPPPLQRPSSGPPPLQRPPLQPPPLQRPPLLREPAAKKKPTDGDTPRRKPEKAGPAIKLAPLPVAQTPTKKKTAEPAPQKPDIKLPPDAIRAGKAGSKPLSEHLRKAEKRKAKSAGRKTAAEQEMPTEGPPSSGRERSRRGGKKVGAAEGPSTALGGREQRQLKRKRAAARRRGGDEDDQTSTPRRRTRIRRVGTNTAAPRKGKVVVELPCTVRSFSEALGVPAARVLGKLLEMGAAGGMNISADLETETAELLAVELGADVDFRHPVSLETELITSLEQQEDDPELLSLRPPVITFLGHVDHGKTSLLDRIIGIDVVSGEKGGITQHIRAYRIEKDEGSIAFVDTPGHEAFTEMRARGANVTDIAVLVVAADDGVMPQTEEAISHARAADVPIVVALNKIDLPGVNPQRAYEQLAANELLPTEWGGDVEVIKTSATTGEGIDELLETLLTVAELHEYKANASRAAVGTCLEAELHEGRGVIAKLLVQTGTMKVGDVVVCGSAYGRIKAMYDTLKPQVRHEQVGPSTPVNVTGLNVAPGAGDRFYVLEEISKAREIAEQRADIARQEELAGARPHVTLENLFERLEEQEIRTLNIILRADVRGSIEAIRKELTKLEHPEVQIKILQATVGGITEADVHLADASDAVIIGFNVVPDENARSLAEDRGVQVRRYDIIYQVTQDLKAALEGLLKPQKFEKDLGRALVKQIFQISRLGTIAGCQVLSGTIERDSRMRVIRESRVIGDYHLDSLRREKDDVREVRAGFECGIKLKGFNDLKEGDILEAYKIEEQRRTLEDGSAA